MARDATGARRRTDFRAALRQLAGRVLLPGAVTLAGRRAGRVLLDRAARWQRLYRAEVAAMTTGHRLLTGREDPAGLARRLRRQLLMEHAGCLRSRLLGSRRAARAVSRVQGAWPADGPFLAFGFHRAGGFAVLDHLAAAGHAPVFLHTPAQEGTAVDRWLGRLESRQLARLGRGELLTTGGSYGRIRELLGGGRVVVALVDAPPAPGQSTVALEILGHAMRLRDGLFRLAAEAGVPVVFFHTLLRDDGTYELVLERLDPPLDAEHVGRAAARALDESLRRDAPGWLYLNGLGSFLDGAPAGR